MSSGPPVMPMGPRPIITPGSMVNTTLNTNVPPPTGMSGGGPPPRTNTTNGTMNTNSNNNLPSSASLPNNPMNTMVRPLTAPVSSTGTGNNPLGMAPRPVLLPSNTNTTTTATTMTLPRGSLTMNNSSSTPTTTTATPVTVNPSTGTKGPVPILTTFPPRTSLPNPTSTPSTMTNSSSSSSTITPTVRPPLSMGPAATTSSSVPSMTTTTTAVRPPLTSVPTTMVRPIIGGINPVPTNSAPTPTTTVAPITTPTIPLTNKPATQVVSTASMFGPAPTTTIPTSATVTQPPSNGIGKPPVVTNSIPGPTTTMATSTTSSLPNTSNSNPMVRPPLTAPSVVSAIRPPLTTIGTSPMNPPSTLNVPRPLGTQPSLFQQPPTTSVVGARPPLTAVPNGMVSGLTPNTLSSGNTVPPTGSGTATSFVRPPLTSSLPPSTNLPPSTTNNTSAMNAPPFSVNNTLPRPNLLQPPVSALGPRGTIPPTSTTNVPQPTASMPPPPLSSASALPTVRPLVPPTTLGNTNAPPLSNLSGPPLPNIPRGPPTLLGNPAVPLSQQQQQQPFSSLPPNQSRPMMNSGPPLPQIPGNLNQPAHQQQHQQQQHQQQYNGPPTQTFNPGQSPFPQPTQSQPSSQAPFGQPMQQQQQPQQSTSQYPGGPPQINTASPSKLGSGIPNSSASQRIDPNQIPRPRYTNPSNPTRYNTLDTQASVPPPAWADFIAEDTGNSNPRFIRSTIGHVPIAKDILKEAKLPFAVMVTPLAAVHPEERGVPLIDFGEDGPIRCSRCKGYINPWVKWTLGDGGRTWNCNLCGMVNETPGWYVPMSGVDQYGLRRDRTERFELSMGSIDMIAPKSYLLRPTAPLCVAFVVDVSLPAITSGLFTTVLTAINASLDTLLRITNGTARVGIITYDSVLQFYDLDPSRREIAIAHAGDVDDAFCPLALDQWCPPIAKARAQIESLITRLPAMFPPTIARSGVSCTSAAIKAAVDGLANTGGRVISYAMQLPLIGEGKLGNRELAKNYGIDKEREMYIPAAGPAGAWYAELAKTATSNGVCIDIASCTPNFFDLPTYATLTIRTGGEIQQYPYFAPSNVVPTMNQLAPVNPVSEEVQEKIIQELNNKFSREMGIETVLKVRTSPGLRVGKYLGNFEERRENEADMAGIDSEKSILVTLQHDGNTIKENEELYVQAALLYTTAAGQRRVRVHNLRLIASDSVQSVFRHADIDAIISYLVRSSVQTTITLDVRTVTKDLIDAAIEMLYSYRRHCASNSSPGQLILPESLKLLPLYLAIILKLPAFTVNKPPSKGMMTLNEVTTRVDNRIVELSALSCMPASRLVPYMYPRLYRIDLLSDSHAVVLPSHTEITYGPDGQPLETPPPPPKIATAILPEEFPRILLPQVIYPSIEQIAPHASYLLEHRNGLFLIIGSDSDEDTFHELFGNGIPNPQALPPGTPLPMLDTDASMRVWTIIYTLRSRRLPYLPVHVIAPSDTMGRNMVNNLLVEDRVGNVRSYVDLLCHVHSEIQSKLTKG